MSHDAEKAMVGGCAIVVAVAVMDLVLVLMACAVTTYIFNFQVAYWPSVGIVLWTQAVIGVFNLIVKELNDA